MMEGLNLATRLPHGWARLNLGSIRRQRTDTFNPARAASEIFELYSVPSHETGRPEFVEGKAIGSNKQHVLPGEVLISKINPRLNRAWVVGNFSSHRKIASTEWTVFPATEHLDAKYLQLALTDARIRDFLAQHASGVGGSLTRARPALFDGVDIPLPPKAEQRRIVAKIEELFSELDKGVEALTTARKQLTAYRQAILKHAFVGRLTEDWRSSDNGISPWQTLPVAELLSCPLCNGRSVKDRPGGFRVLRLTALKQGRIDLAESKEGAWDRATAQPFLVAEGDFFVSRGNGSKSLVGMGGLIGEVASDVAFPDTMIRLRLDMSKVDRRYFALCWNSRLMRQQIERDARTTAGIYKINQDHISAFTMPIPPLEEQRHIVSQLEKQLSDTDFALRQADDELDRAEILRQSVLRRAFSGQLVAQNLKDEPASVLLERISAEREDEAPRKRRKSKNNKKEAA